MRRVIAVAFACLFTFTAIALAYRPAAVMDVTQASRPGRRRHVLPALSLWRTMKTLLALATMALALILPATAGAATVGTTTVHSGGASTAKGGAKAYRFTAASSGQVDRLNVYLDDANTASEVEVGLYSGSLTRAQARGAGGA